MLLLQLLPIVQQSMVDCLEIYRVRMIENADQLNSMLSINSLVYFYFLNQLLLFWSLTWNVGYVDHQIWVFAFTVYLLNIIIPFTFFNLFKIWSFSIIFSNPFVNIFRKGFVSKLSELPRVRRTPHLSSSPTIFLFHSTFSFCLIDQQLILNWSLHILEVVNDPIETLIRT